MSLNTSDLDRLLGRKMCSTFSLGNYMGSEYVGNLGVDGRIRLKRIFLKYDMRV
jgi:hypothetical protein